MFTTKPFGEGTGLGLSIVHDIVTGDLNGTIEVATTPGLGSTFTIRFPEMKDTRHVAQV
jgi:signal transduction histidine kinase